MRKPVFELQLRTPIPRSTVADETTTSRVGSFPCVPVALYITLLAALLYIELCVPQGFADKWAGALRMPRQASRVSALYREAYGFPLLSLSPLVFRALHGLLIAGLWGAYVLSVRRLTHTTRSTFFWSCTLLLILLAVALPPLLSTDVFYYGITGQIAGPYESNPYLVPPSRFPDSALLPYNYWVEFTSPYGPLWTSVSEVLGTWGGNSVLRTTLLFKALGGLCVLAGAVLIHHVVRHLAPERALQATALWAWNPLVLSEGAGNAHNDALVALLLLGGFALLLVHGHTRSFLLLAASSLVKPTTLPIVGLYVLRRLAGTTVRARLLLAVRYVALSVLLTVVAYAPYWGGPATLQGLRSQPLETVQGVIPAAAYGLTKIVTSPSTAALVARTVSLLALILLGLWTIRQLLSMSRSDRHAAPAREAWLWGAVAVLLALVFVRAYPWYTVPGLALLAAAWPHRSRVTLSLYAVTALWFLGRNIV